MWGARKKREMDDSSKPAAAAPFAGDDLLNNLEERLSKLTKAATPPKLQSGFEAMGRLLDQMEDFLNSADFAQLLSPETLQALLASVEQYVPADALQGLDLQDIDSIRRTARQALQELKDVLGDPAQLAALMDKVPPELAQLAAAVGSGDTAALQALLSSLPAEVMDEQQRALLSSMLAGDAAGLQEQVEAMAAAMGIDTDALAAAMAMGMDGSSSPTSSSSGSGSASEAKSRKRRAA